MMRAYCRTVTGRTQYEPASKALMLAAKLSCISIASAGPPFYNHCMSYYFLCFQAAVISFTRLPLSGKHLQPAHFRDAVAWLPVAGLVVGLIATGGYALSQCFFPVPVSIFVALLLAILATGALHEDGFADCCDGFGGGQQPDDMQRIMKDPTIGSYGAIGLMLLLGGKYLFLMQTVAEKHLLILPAMHVLARFVPLLLIASTPPVNNPQAKMSAGLTVSRARLVWAGFFSAGVALILLPAGLCLLLAVALLLLSLIWRAFVIRHLGGYNGDCLGAGEQLAECLILLICVAYF